MISNWNVYDIRVLPNIILQPCIHAWFNCDIILTLLWTEEKFLLTFASHTAILNIFSFHSRMILVVYNNFKLQNTGLKQFCNINTTNHICLLHLLINKSSRETKLHQTYVFCGYVTVCC